MTTVQPRRVHPAHPSPATRPASVTPPLLLLPAWQVDRPEPVGTDMQALARAGRARALATKAARRQAALPPVETVLVNVEFRARIEELLARRVGVQVFWSACRCISPAWASHCPVGQIKCPTPSRASSRNLRNLRASHPRSRKSPRPRGGDEDVAPADARNLRTAAARQEEGASRRRHRHADRKRRLTPRAMRRPLLRSSRRIPALLGMEILF